MEALRLVGMEEFATRPATKLSGGQQQRVALARALACKPQVLLLDDPFAALHTTLRRQLRDELRALRERLGIPAVIASHDPEDVLALADEFFRLDGGRVQHRLRAGAADLRATLERPL